MLEIEVKGGEFVNESTMEFFYPEPETLKLEHNLLSLAKWEAKWKKPFLSMKPHTAEEQLDYIRCMTINDVDPLIYRRLNIDDLKKIRDYMADPMTATTFSKDDRHRPNREVMTAELFYYQMTALNIPFECETWHLNRLMTLIRVCAIKNAPPKKMSKSEAARRRAQLNSERRQRSGSTG